MTTKKKTIAFEVIDRLLTAAAFPLGPAAGGAGPVGAAEPGGGAP